MCAPPRILADSKDVKMRAWARWWALIVIPPDPAGSFSEGSEVIKFHIEGSLTIPRTVIKGYNDGNIKNGTKHWGRIGRVCCKSSGGT